MTAPLHRAAAVMRAFLAICLLSPVAVLGACGSDAPTPPTGQPAVAESLAVLSVDTPQVVGEGVEVRVRVTNLRGRPVPNEAVEWAVVNGPRRTVR